MIESFEVFLVAITPPGQKQDGAFRSTGGQRPVYPADRPAILGMPETLDRICGDRTTVNKAGLRLRCVANTSLLAVVTIW